MSLFPPRSSQSVPGHPPETIEYLGKGQSPPAGWWPLRATRRPSPRPPRAPAAPRPHRSPDRAGPGRARGPRHHSAVYSSSGPASSKTPESPRRTGPGCTETADPSPPLCPAPPKNEVGGDHPSPRIPAHLPAAAFAAVPLRSGSGSRGGRGGGGGGGGRGEAWPGGRVKKDSWKRAVLLPPSKAHGPRRDARPNRSAGQAPTVRSLVRASAGLRLGQGYSGRTYRLGNERLETSFPSAWGS